MTSHGPFTDSSPESLDELVSQTRGLQPWRKAFHAFSGLVIAGGVTFLDLTRAQAMMILGGVGIVLLASDLVRLKSRRMNEIFFRSFRHLASAREATGLASSTWYAFGALVAFATVPRPEAVSGLLVLGLADPVASVIGQRYGRRPFLGGSIEGTAMFVLVSLAILVPRHAWPAAILATVVATVAERRSWPLDDNFTVPVVTGLVLYATTSLL